MTAEAPRQSEQEVPRNRQERRALARGKKGGAAAKNPMRTKKNGKLRSQLPTGRVGKFQLPTKNG